MNKFKESAIAILKKVGKPLHSSEITRLALESGILETDGARPENSMSAQITTEIKYKGDGSDFVRTGPGIFALNPNKKEIIENPNIVEAENEEEEKLVTESGFVGKGGEHAVCSELLFRGFNASIMSVDVGVDISAIKDNKFFGIQVKTSQKNNNDIYNFHIKKKSFDRFNQGNIFYILVLRDSKKASYLIIPSGEIAKKIKENAIFSVNNKSGYALSVKIRDEKIYLGNMNYEMGYFLNNWDLIK